MNDGEGNGNTTYTPPPVDDSYITRVTSALGSMVDEREANRRQEEQETRRSGREEKMTVITY